MESFFKDVYSDNFQVVLDIGYINQRVVSSFRMLTSTEVYVITIYGIISEARKKFLSRYKTSGKRQPISGRKYSSPMT